MSTATVSIAVSIATLLVVGAAAVAAIIQLRHLRTSNQLSALLEIMTQWNLPAVQAALSETQKIPEKVADPNYLQAMRMPGSLSRTQFPELLALDFWEQVGTYAKHGLIDEDILLDITSAQVSDTWKHSEPAIAIFREYRGASVFENFEYLAVRSELWQRKYPNGSYPARLPRMADLNEREAAR